jgi:signal transduction histidine kinase
VVRDLAVLHGGKTWVEENPGGGARFVVELGLATPPRDRAAVDAAATAVRETV